MVMDDYSRFNLIAILNGETFGDTIPVMRKIFLNTVCQKVILCDNGNPWSKAPDSPSMKYG